MANYIDASEGIAIDELPKYFRGVVVKGKNNGIVMMGLKGHYEDKENFKEFLPGAKWDSLTKSWLVEMNNSNQAEVFSGLAKAKAKLNLPDVAIEGCKPAMRQGIIKAFQGKGIL